MKKILFSIMGLLFILSCQTTADNSSTNDDPNAVKGPMDKKADADAPAVVLNGDFAVNTSYWECDTSGGQATFTVVDGEVVVEIASAGTDTWSVGMYQHRMNLRKGYEYTVTFKARSIDPRVIHCYVGQNQAPYRTYGGETTNGFEITDVMTEYSYSFTSKVDDEYAQLAISLGRIKGTNETTLYFDDITITEVAK